MRGFHKRGVTRAYFLVIGILLVGMLEHSFHEAEAAQKYCQPCGKVIESGSLCDPCPVNPGPGGGCRCEICKPCNRVPLYCSRSGGGTIGVPQCACGCLPLCEGGCGEYECGDCSGANGCACLKCNGSCGMYWRACKRTTCGCGCSNCTACACGNKGCPCEGGISCGCTTFCQCPDDRRPVTGFPPCDSPCECDCGCGLGGNCSSQGCERTSCYCKGASPTPPCGACPTKCVLCLGSHGCEGSHTCNCGACGRASHEVCDTRCKSSASPNACGKTATWGEWSCSCGKDGCDKPIGCARVCKPPTEQYCDNETSSSCDRGGSCQCCKFGCRGGEDNNEGYCTDREAPCVQAIPGIGTICGQTTGYPPEPLNCGCISECGVNTQETEDTCNLVAGGQCLLAH